MKFIRLLKNNSKDSSYLLLDKKKVNCKIGANGIGIKAREGDFVTPKGIFSLEKVFFRADRMKRPKTSLKIKKIQKFYFWCSDPKTVNYNKLLVKKRIIDAKIYIEMILYTILFCKPPLIVIQLESIKGAQFLFIVLKKVGTSQRVV